MPIKKCGPEQIVKPPQQIEVEIANGNATPRACKEISGVGAGECQADPAGGKTVARETDSKESGGGKLLNPERWLGAARMPARTAGYRAWPQVRRTVFTA
jgi:hypothetical protein